MLPTFPPGATLHSILIACAQTGRIPSVRQGLCAPYLRQPDWSRRISMDPALVAKHVFEDSISAADLCLHHTLSPIELSFDWRIRVICGTSRSLYFRYPSDLMSANSLRSCPQCVAEDMKLFGCGHWRREHQLYSVEICTKHLTALHNRCADSGCGREFSVSSALLPGQPCPYCKSTKTTGKQLGPISEGYQAYCKLFTDALHNRIPEVDKNRVHDFFQLPNLFCDGNTPEFGNFLFHWLGPQLRVADFVWDAATEFMYRRQRTRNAGHFFPALFLLTALKRKILGAPPEDESFSWSSFYASKTQSQGSGVIGD